MPQIKKGYLLVSLFIIIQLALSVTGGILVTSLPKDNKINQGINIAGINVGGLTKSQAEENLTRHFQLPFQGENLKLTNGNKIWEISYIQLGADYNYQAAINKAYSVGRDGGLLGRLYIVFKLSRKDMEIPLEINFNEKKLKDELVKIASQINKSAKNAAIDLLDDRIKITPEEIGREVDIKENQKIILKGVNDSRNKAVALLINDKDPEVKAEDLTEIKDPLALAVTVVAKESPNRTENIKLAAGILNGTVIKPEEVFSFNKKIGPRLKESGYKEAPVINEDRVVSGVGGGVCQLSTTLYDSALIAGFDIKERSPHSKPVSYVPIGQDASVADGQLDLKFVNTSRYPIGIISKVEKDKLVIRIFGRQDKINQTIKILSEDVQTIEPKVIVNEDPELNKGYSQIIKQGVQGYQSKVYRVWYDKGKEFKKELISDTIYQPDNTVIRVGTKPVSFNNNGK